MTELGLFVHLAPGQKGVFDEQLLQWNENGPDKLSKIKKMDLGEFMVCHGINVLSTSVEDGITELYRQTMNDDDVLPPPNFSEMYGVPKYRFEEWRKFFSLTTSFKTIIKFFRRTTSFKTVLDTFGLWRPFMW